jgi:hypothetical protein
MVLLMILVGPVGAAVLVLNTVRLADAMTVLVWVEAGSGVRLDRGVARDGQAMRDHWIAWREAEEALFAREGTRERADVTVRT